MWSARLLGRSLQASGDRRRRGMTVLDRTRLTGRFPLLERHIAPERHVTGQRGLDGLGALVPFPFSLSSLPFCRLPV